MDQLYSGAILDDDANTYVLAVENFKKAAQSVVSELGAHVVPVDSMDTSLPATSGSFLFIGSVFYV